MPDGVKITFTRDYEVQDQFSGTPHAERYQEGKSYTLPEASAAHFINRGAAVPYAKPAPQRAAPKPDPEDDGKAKA